MNPKFKITFIPKAAKEYRKFDGSVKKLVDLALRKMEERADELGEELVNKQGTKLLGCRKIKFRSAGIRIVYRIIGDKAEVVEVIAIGKREDNEVYQLASKRLQELVDR
jgi:mRNA interferase RelE/StbE